MKQIVRIKEPMKGTYFIGFAAMIGLPAFGGKKKDAPKYTRQEALEIIKHFPMIALWELELVK